MASSRKTLDVEVLTINTVYARGYKNTVIPSTSVLMSDGKGGTYWSLVSTVGTYPSFQKINIDSNSYSATPTTQTFSFLTGNGIGFADAGPGSNATYLYAKAFQTIAVQGLSSLTAFTSNTLTPTLTLSSLGGLQLSTDTLHQVLYFNAGIKNFNVLSNTSTFTSNLTGTTPTSFSITPMLSTLTFMGVGDITLTPSATNSVFVGIQGFTSAGYIDLSGQVYTLQSSILTTASTLFINKDDFYNRISTFSTTVGYELSSYQISSTYLALSTLSVSNISTYSTFYSSLSTNVYFNISTLSSYFYAVNQSTLSTFVYNNLASTIVGYSSVYSTITGYNIGNLMSTISTYSTIASTNLSSIQSLYKLLNSTNLSTLFLTSTLIASTVSFTGENLSTMSTTMTSTFTSLFTPRLNLVSSLGYTGTWGDGIRFRSWPTVASASSNTGILFSTISLNFSSISSAFTSKNISLSIDYSPTILFPMANSVSNAFYNSPITVSSYFAYQESAAGPGGADPYNCNAIPTFPINTQTMMINQYNLGQDAITSNLFSKYMRLTLDPTYIQSNYTGNYTLYHYLPSTTTSFCNINSNTGDSINSTVHIRTSLQNSLFINLFNLS
jgi:hypothetical protein